MKAQLLCLTRDEENNCAYAVFYVKPNGSTYTFFTDKVKLVPKAATPPPVVDSSSSSEVVDSSETEDSSSVVDSSVTSESGMTFNCVGGIDGCISMVLLAAVVLLKKKQD